MSVESGFILTKIGMGVFYLIIAPALLAITLSIFVRFSELLKIPEILGKLGAKLVRNYKASL